MGLSGRGKVRKMRQVAEQKGGTVNTGCPGGMKGLDGIAQALGHSGRGEWKVIEVLRSASLTKGGLVPSSISSNCSGCK